MRIIGSKKYTESGITGKSRNLKIEKNDINN